MNARETQHAARPRRALLYAAAGAGAALLVVTTLAALRWAEPRSGDDARGAATPGAAPAAVTVVGTLTARPLPAPSPLAATAPESPAHVPVSDEMPQSEPPPREGTEGAYYARYLELVRQRDGSLTAVAERVFDERTPAPANERVALLRALWDGGSADAVAWFSRALTAPGERAESEAPVPDFAARFLAERALREPAARTILAGYVAAAPEDCDPGRLARAAAALDEDAPVAPSGDR